MLRNRLLAYCLLFSLLLNAREYEYNYTFFTTSSMSGDYFFTHTAATGNAMLCNCNMKTQLRVNGGLPFIDRKKEKWIILNQHRLLHQDSAVLKT